MLNSTELQSELDGILSFLKTAERLKSTMRTSFSAEGRQESTAEHTWRLTLMALTLEKYFPKLDFPKLVKMLIVHDLGEVINGDIPTILQDPSADKNEAERNDFESVISPLPAHMRIELLALFDEYNAAITPEAKLAKALDKLETLLQHTQGKNPEDFDYAFNLRYGQEYTSMDQITSYLRSVIDQETAKRLQADS